MEIGDWSSISGYLTWRAINLLLQINVPIIKDGPQSRFRGNILNLNNL